MKPTLSCLATALVIATMASSPALAQQKPAPAAAKAPAAGKPLARVNGTNITPVMGELLFREVRSQGAPDSEEIRREVRDELIRREVLAQQARKRGLDKNPEIQARLDMARQTVLVGAYVADWEKTNRPSDAQLRAEYDRLVKSAGSQKEYDARHIVTSKEDDAKAVIAKLQSGAKFEDLVKEYSIDPGTKNQGGELGWAPANVYMPQLAEALAKLEKNQYTTQAIKTDYGFHVIQLKDTRAAQPPAFEQEKPRIEQALRQQALYKHVEDLVGKTKVE